jgi:hypothetical protein
MKAMELKVSRKGYWRNISITLTDPVPNRSAIESPNARYFQNVGVGTHTRSGLFSISSKL